MLSEVDPRSSCRKTGPGVWRFSGPGFYHRHLGFDQGVVLGIATTMLRDGAATGVGNPQHGLSGTTDVIKVQTTSEARFLRRLPTVRWSFWSSLRPRDSTIAWPTSIVTSSGNSRSMHSRRCHSGCFDGGWLACISNTWARKRLYYFQPLRRLTYIFDWACVDNAEIKPGGTPRAARLQRISRALRPRTLTGRLSADPYI
ncbi:hypothetical protein MULP_00099 [Mycobacterium liflandii 128FXT]|uniref:Uncharacterized protein n=1 Tax=Mycobacterium liflandii (strain 128FXT) TaxID=459424 RepID=L7V477_MYCL1|nr:hypothetical protein MULP_00099 [Mycobacterium liflandii 128FXT]MBC9863937.1 hypothetical protein [Mycobacterium pseudoshottsii]BEH74305.1 hypothetical protein YM3MPS_01080 [Mycobacterium pseudoshottsii]